MSDKPGGIRTKRWRMILGAPAEESLGVALTGTDAAMDRTLEALYDSDRAGGLGASSPRVSRWLGDVRTYFPTSVVRIMQKDAMDRLDLKRMLLEPELLESVEPDVHLAATLVSLSKVMPNRTKDTARRVVGRVVAELERRLAGALEQAVRGSLSRQLRNSRPKAGEIDFERTIRKNLRHYQPSKNTIIAEQLVGFGRKRSRLRDVILCIDQSGSMAASVVYASVFGAVLATLRALTTKVVVFDTNVVDLSHLLHDPVELLFGTQLGGGTEIHRALAYVQSLVERPRDTVVVLITDLFEGGSDAGMMRRAAALVASGVQVICLLALSDEGTPAHHEENAARLAKLGVPTFSCTPDMFPELMAQALQRRDIAMWASRRLTEAK